MSGSGGGGGGGSGGGPTITSCDKLMFRTPLNSPVSSVVKSLKVGDQLEVIAVSPKGPAIVQDSSGNKAGSITALQLARLLKCIDDGYTYSATVISITGGRVEVEIRPE